VSIFNPESAQISVNERRTVVGSVKLRNQNDFSNLQRQPLRSFYLGFTKETRTKKATLSSSLF
jgi:hypothetical protein